MLRHGAEGRIDPAKLAFEPCLVCGRDLESKAQQARALLVGEQAAGHLERGEFSFLRAKQEQILRLPVPHGGQRAELHLVGHRRDRADLVAAEQEVVELQKCLVLHTLSARDLPELLERLKQIFIELLHLLRTLWLLLRRQSGTLLRKRLGQAGIRYKPCDSLHLRGDCIRLAQRAAQRGQRRDRRGTVGFQRCKYFTILIRPRLAEAARMERQLPFPRSAVQIPAEGIALQLVGGFTRERRKRRFEIVDDRFIFIPLRRMERTAQRGDHRTLEQRRRPGKIGRDTRTDEGRAQNRQIGGGVGHSDGDLAAANAGLHQPPDIGCGEAALLRDALRAVREDVRRVFFARLATTGKEHGQPALDVRRANRTFRDVLHRDRHAEPRGKLFQRPGGLLCRGEDRLLLHPGLERERNVRLRQERLKNLQLNSGKIGKTVEEERLVRGIVRFEELFVQAIEPRDRVAAARLAYSKIALVEQAQLLQLLRKLTLRARRRIQQGLRRDAIGQKFLDRSGKLLQKGGFDRSGSVIFEVREHLLRGEIHREQPPALVEIFLADAAVDGRHAGGEAREAQNFSIAADRVTARAAERALGLVGILLRDDQDIAAFSRLRPRADGAEQRSGRRQAVRAAEQCQHPASPLSSRILFIISSRAKKGKRAESGCILRKDMLCLSMIKHESRQNNEIRTEKRRHSGRHKGYGAAARAERPR